MSHSRLINLLVHHSAGHWVRRRQTNIRLNESIERRIGEYQIRALIISNELLLLSPPLLPALVRDTHTVGGDVEGSKPKIRLFTAAGELLATLPSEVSNIVGMNWTSKEQLVVVSDDGTVILYSVHGERLASFSALPNEAKADGVAEVDFWPDGLVVRTGLKSELWAITSWSNPRPVRLADALLDRPPTSMVVLGQEHGCEVMLATANGSIICVDGNQAQDQLLTSGPFARMALSPNGSLLAAFNDDGTLHLMSTDFKSCLSKFATGSKIPPTQLTWCDDESILLAWPGMLLLVGLLGDFVKFSMDTPFHLVAEFDGTRIVTAETTEWLSRVPESSESIFKPGSNTPAARLYDAQEAFAAGEARADDNLRELSSDPAAMKQAIEQCLHAAAHEIEYEMQRMLLKAASYGKLVCPAYKADKFTDYCRIMRVLNAVRNPSVGMPLTYSQYLQLEADVLVDRLVNRHQHLLAMRICEYLRIHPERVLVHWACQKIKHCADELSDAQLGEMIVKKLSLCPGISYSNIASTAFRYGKRSLATLVSREGNRHDVIQVAMCCSNLFAFIDQRLALFFFLLLSLPSGSLFMFRLFSFFLPQLLEYEPLASDQVPLLMSMKEDELALTKAIQSGDTDLVYLALLHLKKHRKQKDFFALIREKPLARDLYISYCKQTDLPSLKVKHHSTTMRSKYEGIN